jgi:hypothetical protein
LAKKFRLSDSLFPEKVQNLIALPNVTASRSFSESHCFVFCRSKSAVSVKLSFKLLFEVLLTPTLSSGGIQRKLNTAAGILGRSTWQEKTSGKGRDHPSIPPFSIPLFDPLIVQSPIGTDRTEQRREIISRLERVLPVFSAPNRSLNSFCILRVFSAADWRRLRSGAAKGVRFLGGRFGSVHYLSLAITSTRNGVISGGRHWMLFQCSHCSQLNVCGPFVSQLTGRLAVSVPKLAIVTLKGPSQSAHYCND